MVLETDLRLEMVSGKAEDYEVISILGAGRNSTWYKVRHKATQEVFVWKAVSCEGLSSAEKQQLVSQVEKLKHTDHTHLLRIHNHILQDEARVLYLVCEYSTNDNITSAIRRCVLQNEYLREDFLWRILYQVSSTLAIGGESLLGTLNTDNTFLDADFNVKLFDDNILKLSKSKSTPLANLGLLMLQLCTLQIGNSSVNKKISEIPNYYSNELTELIRFISTANLSVKSIINAILYHPTVLLKSCTKLDTIYVANEKLLDNTTLENLTNTEIEAVCHLKIERTRNREMALKLREEKLIERERQLHKREKNVAQMEVTVKEKMLQAKLYLRRCRAARSGNSLSSGRTTSYDDVDSSFSAHGDDTSFVVATSNKMDLQQIKKPARFMSDKKVHFKGHSPLKDICTRENRAHKNNKCQKNIELCLISPGANRKPSSNAEAANLTSRSLLDMPRDRRPFSWTDESKQQAFDLLRLLNQTNRTGMKHTNL